MYGEPFETIPVEKLVALFNTADAMHTSRVKILKAHYNCPGHAATARELARLVGYKGHQGINLQYGKFVQSLAKEYADPEILSHCQHFWLLFLMTYKNRRATHEEGLLTLRDNVVQTLKEIDW